MKIGSSNRSEGVSKKFRKNVCREKPDKHQNSPEKCSVRRQNIVHLVKHRVGALPDASPFGLSGHSYLDDRFDVDAR